MDKIAEKMAELADKFGPSVIDAARGAVRVEAYSTMAGAFQTAVIATAMIFAGRFLWNYQTADSFDRQFPRVVAFLLFGLSVIPFAVAAWAFIDPWTWTAISNPDLYLAKKILKI